MNLLRFSVECTFKSVDLPAKISNVLSYDLSTPLTNGAVLMSSRTAARLASAYSIGSSGQCCTVTGRCTLAA